MKRFFGVNVWLAALIVSAMQSAVLAYMVVDRAQLLQNGREIILDVLPVDPRSLFRGDYVILNYGPLSRIDGKLFTDIPEDTRTVYVTARKGEIPQADLGRRQPRVARPDPEANGQAEVGQAEVDKPVIGWIPVAVSASVPAAVSADAVVLRGEIEHHYGGPLSNRKFVPVRYGIESYFVPEGEGKQLEKLIGKGEMRVIAAIGEDGRAGIKGIEARGKRVYEEPIW